MNFFFVPRPTTTPVNYCSIAVVGLAFVFCVNELMLYRKNNPDRVGLTRLNLVLFSSNEVASNNVCSSHTLGL
jgi:hypothetical protein